MAEDSANDDGETAILARTSWSVKVIDASKDGDIVKFTIQTNTGEGTGEKGVVVLRQYDDFEWLYHCLTTQNKVDGIVIPPLPPKPVVTASAAEAKSKKQLGKGVKNMIGDEFNKDCRNLEKFVQLLLVHPTFKKDENLEKFLINDEAPVRAKVKKSLMSNLSKSVSEARFHSYKDIDEDFQKHRDFTDRYSTEVKEVSANFARMVHSQQRVALALGELSSAVQTATAVDEPCAETLKSAWTTFSSALTCSKESLDVMSTNDENTLGFSLELYSRYMEAAKEMLFQRTCKLVEFENAGKALEKAKPKNLDQLENAKKEAEEAYNEISEVAKKEMTRFNHQRVLSLQSSLIQYADAHITNGRDTYAVLAKLLSDVKNNI